MTISTSSSDDGTITFWTSSRTPTAVVVFLHGLGDTALSWENAVADLARNLPHVKFVVPTAGKRPVAFNNGIRKHSWYDVQTLESIDGNHNANIDNARELVLALIENEVAAGLPHARIVLGGFRQGGGLALYTAYQLDKIALGGVMCLSGRVPQWFDATPATTSVPLFMCHAEMDPILPVAQARASVAKLQRDGVRDVDFRVYPDMKLTDMGDVTRWLERVVPPRTA